MRPFKGLRYVPQVVGELSEVICPPFDTITPELRKSLYQRSPYNVVRLEDGESLPSDAPHDNRFTRAATTLGDWMGDEVLALEEQPAFYLVQHAFKFRGREWTRLELMACVRLEEYQRRVVFPHEYTRDQDKRDRLALMEACHANFSPIMCLYRDGQSRLSPIFQRTMAEPCLIDLRDGGEQGYRVWRIEDPKRTDGITEAMFSKSLYIADGHHRYETALTYRGLVSAGRGGVPILDEAFNFVLMGLIEFDDPGLLVLPYHRVLGGLGDATLTQVRDGLKELFEVEPFPGGVQAKLEKFSEEIEVRGREQSVLGLLDPGADGFQLLTLKQGINLDTHGPVARSEAWIVEEQVLKPILGESLAQRLAYVHDGDEAEARVRSGEYQLGFFMKGFPLGLFETIMNMGQRLPPKSTFFYPKLPTGLVINLLEGKF